MLTIVVLFVLVLNYGEQIEWELCCLDLDFDLIAHFRPKHDMLYLWMCDGHGHGQGTVFNRELKYGQLEIEQGIYT